MAISNLASTLSKLGKYQDALVLLESVLELFQRTLPAEHPDLGITCFY
jgi:hypothetical protein